MTGEEWVVLAGTNVARLAALASAMENRDDWLRRAFDGPAAVFTQPRCPYAASSGSADAVVMGAVFQRHGPNDQPGKLGDTAWRELRQGLHGLFLAHCWGGFVSLCSEGGELRVIRDPSAAMPCYYAHFSGVVLLGSSVAAMVEAGLSKPVISMGLLARCLFRAELPSPETALFGVRELLPGDCLLIDSDQLEVRQVWSPWDYAKIDASIDFAEHANRLLRAVQNSVLAWGRVAISTVVGVSGGLDSSIVATCLSTHTPRPTCVTISVDDAEGDERLHARRICDHLELELVEAHYDLADIDIGRPARPNLPRPTGRLIAQGYNAAASRAAHENSAEAFFTGNGGDNVFAYSHSAGAIADRVLHEGPFGGAWKTAQDICRLTGCNMIEAWKSALRLAARRRDYQWKPTRQFLHRDILHELDREALTHRWLEAPDGALPGKAAHIAGLLRIQRHLEGTGLLGGVRVIHPLMSQPVIETCLAIPSWMWCQGGRDRSVARHAFRHLMPAAIAYRVSKGGPTGFAMQIITRFRERITERLLDGNLAANGIIDRGALERRLHDESPNWANEQVRILELLEAEAWMDHWR